MIHKFILAFIAIFSVVINTQAQSESDSIPIRKNAIRFNIVPPLAGFNTLEISYERMISPKVSVVAGIGGNWTGNKSDFVLNSDADLSFLNRDIKNRYIIAEVRRFINFCDCNPPSGFYAGGFARYNMLDISTDVQFGDDSANLNTKLDMNFRSINFGILLGYQINYKNWVVDFDFGGVGYAPNWVEFNSSSTLSSDELAQLSDVLSQNFGFAGNYKEIELNSSNAKFNFWAWTIRYGASIGYRF